MNWCSWGGGSWRNWRCSRGQLALLPRAPASVLRVCGAAWRWPWGWQSVGVPLGALEWTAFYRTVTLRLGLFPI